MIDAAGEFRKAVWGSRTYIPQTMMHLQREPILMRQYRVFYKRAGAKEYGVLKPLVHANLYTRPEVQAAVTLMRTTPVYEGIALRVEDEQFNIMAFDQAAEAPNAFKFEEPTPTPEIVVEDSPGSAVDL